MSISTNPPPSQQLLLEKGKKEAEHYRVNCVKSEEMFQKIQNTYHCSISQKYQAIFYFASTGNYSAEELADMFEHSKKNINVDFNKNLGIYLKDYFELDDNERVGITSLRRFLFKRGYLMNINDNDLINILDNRLSEYSILRQ